MDSGKHPRTCNQHCIICKYHNYNYNHLSSIMTNKYNKYKTSATIIKNSEKKYCISNSDSDLDESDIMKYWFKYYQ